MVFSQAFDLIKIERLSKLAVKIAHLYLLLVSYNYNLSKFKGYRQETTAFGFVNISSTV